MRRRDLGPLILGIALQGALHAQIRTLPASHEAAEGNTADTVVTRVGHSRAQYQYHASTLPAKRVFRRIHLRQDGQVRAQHVAHAFDWEIWISSKTTTWVPLDVRSFKANERQDQQKVVGRRSVRFPAVSQPAQPPAKWALAIPADRPTLLAGGHVILDIRCWAARAPATFLWFADASSDGAEGSFAEFGSACPADFEYEIYNHHVGARMRGNGNMGTGATSRKAAIAWIGAARTAIGIPGTGCSLYTLPVLVAARPGLTNRDGDFQIPWFPVPKGVENAVLHHQCVVLDPPFNKIGMRVSAGLWTTIGRGHARTLAVYAWSTQARAFDPARDDRPTFNQERCLVIGIE